MFQDSIRFPHLHIFLPHVPDGITIGGFHIAFYGMIIALAILLGGYIVIREAARLGLPEDDFYDCIFLVAVSGILGARVYYVLFEWERYRDHPIDILNLRQGGLGIYGGIITAFIALAVFSHWKKLSLPTVLDVCLFGGLLGQIMGRWGNFFNREAFGVYTDSLFAMQIPVAAVRQPEAVTAEMLRHAVTERGLEIISVHPTFLYESLWNLGIFLLLWSYRKHKRAEGELFFIYVALYGAGRFWIEGLRTDQLRLYSSGPAVSRIVAACCVVIGTAVVFYVRNSQKSD